MYKFLSEVNEEFAPVKRLRNIFLMDGTPILDLVEVPDNEKCLFVSNISSFRSIILSNIKTIKINEQPVETTSRKREVKISNLAFFNKFRTLKKKTKRPIKNKKFLQFNKISKKEFNEKYEKDFKNNTFVDENISVDDWDYKSDNEQKKIPVGRRLHEEVQSPNDMFIYFTEFWALNKEKYLRSLLRCDSEGNVKKSKVGKKENIEKLVDKYNSEREEKARRHLKRKHEKKNESVILQNTNLFMRKFIQDLGVNILIKKILKTQNPEDYDDNILKEYEEEQKNKKERFMIDNKERVQNLYFQIDQKVNKFYPDLIRFNIPKLLSTYPTLTRKELFELFVQYKSLMKICIALNRSMKILKKGVDFKTFHQGVSQMSTESEDLARKIFNTINERNNNYLSWEEFLKGMITIKSDSISDKIDMFFKIIDTDGNGLLSYSEVLDLSLMSLKRNIKGEDKNSEEVVGELAKYFADLIFKLVDIDKDDEIPLPRIKEVLKLIKLENH